MLAVTTFQAETTFRDRSADKLRQLFCLDTTRGFWLPGDRPLHASFFLSCFNSGHKPVKIFMTRRRYKSINKCKRLGSNRWSAQRPAVGQALGQTAVGSHRYTFKNCTHSIRVTGHPSPFSWALITHEAWKSWDLQAAEP